MIPAAGKHFLLSKRDCPYVFIILLARKNGLTICLAGFLTCPESDLPVLHADSGVRMLSFCNGLHSSGHCSGFTPDSLLYDDRKSPYHQSGGKDRKIFKMRRLLYYLKLILPGQLSDGICFIATNKSRTCKCLFGINANPCVDNIVVGCRTG